MDDKLHLFIRTEFQFHRAQSFTFEIKIEKYFYSSLKSVQQTGKVGIKVSQIVLDIVKGSSQIEYFFYWEIFEITDNSIEYSKFSYCVGSVCEMSGCFSHTNKSVAEF